MIQRLRFAALILAVLVRPLGAQTRTDTLNVHPGDTIPTVVPATCPLTTGSTTERRCWLNVQGPTTTYLQHTLLRITARPVVTPPPVVVPPPVTPPPSGTFATPDLANNVSFESGWDDFKSSSFGAPASITRDNTRAFNGTISARRALPNTMSSTDQGGGMDFQFYAGPPWGPAGMPAQTFDRLWTRFYFYVDAAISGPFKFHQLYSGGYGTQFSGLYFFDGNLACLFTPEAAGGGIVQAIAPLTQLVGAWHWIEMDYWRNGDPSGWPSVALWLDGQPVTHFLSAPTAPMRWDANGRLQLGARASTQQIGLAHWLGVLNGKNTGGLGNSVPGNVWVDRISISSKGRIGP